MIGRGYRHETLRSPYIRNLMVEDNMGLVYKVVFYLCKIHRISNDHDQADAIQLGALALMRAAELWDPEVSKFSTYAMATIKNRLSRELPHRSLIKVPEYARKEGVRPPQRVTDLDEDRFSPLETLPAKDDNLDEHLDNETQWQVVESVVKRMPTKWQTIYTERLVKCRLLQEVGDELGLTKERIRQVEKAIIKRLKSELVRTTTGST